jgi:hypothetical protein
MHRPDLISAVIFTGIIILLLVFLLRNLPKPPRPPRHPVPANEPPFLHLLLRIKRLRVDEWHL